MKKVVFILICTILILSMLSCDFRQKLSDKKLQELYEEAKNAINDSDKDFLYYDYSNSFVYIKKEDTEYFSDLTLNDLAISAQDFKQNIKYMLNNMTPNEMDGYKTSTKVKYFVSLQYEPETINDLFKTQVESVHINCYDNSNIGIEISAFDNENNYKIELIIGDINIENYSVVERV